MKIEIWSDVVCPWCYIGKRRFEAALAQFKHREQFTVEWRSFQLDPTAPRSSTETLNEILAKKYRISPKQAAETTRQVTELAAKEGLEYHLDKAQHANTYDAHRLIHFAAAHDLQDAMKERLLKAYFTEGVALGDIETLVSLAAEVGLDKDEVRTALETNAYADEVAFDKQQANALGIRGVPFFVIDEKYGISGAQPPEFLLQALEQAWSESQPLIMVGAANQDAGQVCDDASCAI